MHSTKHAHGNGRVGAKHVHGSRTPGNPSEDEAFEGSPEGRKAGRDSYTRGRFLCHGMEFCHDKGREASTALRGLGLLRLEVEARPLNVEIVSCISKRCYLEYNYAKSPHAVEL